MVFCPGSSANNKDPRFCSSLSNSSYKRNLVRDLRAQACSSIAPSRDQANRRPMDGSGRGLLGAFLQGWKSKPEADPEFAFKVLMEELVGASACILGDMASHPNFSLYELDFVFSTLVIGSILSFVVMYLLAPSSTTLSAKSLCGVLASCPMRYMFEPGAYGVLDRLGTFSYKGSMKLQRLRWLQNRHSLLLRRKWRKQTHRD